MIVYGWLGGLVGVAAGLFFIISTEPRIPKPAPRPAAPAKTPYQIGKESLGLGDYPSAEAAFQESVRTEPDHQVEALLSLAETSLKQGRLNETGDYLTRARTADPGNATVEMAWARYLSLRRRLPEAEAAYKAVIALAPKAIQPLAELGDLYLIGLQKPQEAIEVYRAALLLDPGRAAVQYALGAALTETGELDEAERAFKEAARLAPKNPLAFQSLGHLYVTRKEYDRALQTYQAALAADPNFVLARLARGDVLLARGDDESARAEYVEALKIKPSLAEAQFKLGISYQRTMQWDLATRAYLDTITLDPSVALAYNNLAWIAAEQQVRLDEALAWANAAVELAPRTALCYDTLGWVQRARGELDQAVTSLEQATALKPDFAEAFYHLGVVRHEAGDTKAAITALDKALALNPHYMEAKDARKRLGARRT